MNSPALYQRQFLFLSNPTQAQDGAVDHGVIQDAVKHTVSVGC